jgi:ribosome-associated translation inhibitor RaiA
MIEKKLSKSLQRYPKPLTVRLAFSGEKNSEVSAALRLNFHGRELLAKATANNNLSAFHEAMAKIDRQFHKRFDKMNKIKREKPFRIDEPMIP